jgi:prepilin-type processing-associated H-X9-DG protein
VSNAAGTIAYSDKMYNSDTFYHEEGCNAVFMDGHAAWIPDQNGILKDFIAANPPYYGGVLGAKAYKLMEYLAGNNNPDFPDWTPDADDYGL